MKTTLKLIGWTLLAALLLSILIVATGTAWLTPLAHATIQIDDDTLTLAALHGSDWLLAVGAITVAVMAALVGVLLALLIVPLAVLLPLLVAALAIGVAVAVVLGVAALAASPLLLIGWLLWRLVRSERPRNAAPAATIPA
jgi:hypothetical protein